MMHRSSKVVIDFYVDLVCPDSARAFPTLQDVVAHFSGEDLAVFLHQFPLPYHRNGHLLAQVWNPFQIWHKNYIRAVVGLPARLAWRCVLVKSI